MENHGPSLQRKIIICHGKSSTSEKSRRSNTTQMDPNLVVVGENDAVLQGLEANFDSSPDFSPAPKKDCIVDKANILYVNAISHGSENLASNSKVEEALNRGIPIVVSHPSAIHLENLTGVGIPNVDAALVIRGRNRVFLCETFEEEKQFQIEGGSVVSEDGVVEAIENEEGLENATTQKHDIHRKILETLSSIDKIEAVMKEANKNVTYSADIPENREWTYVYRRPGWREWSLKHRWKNERQYIRYTYHITFRLLAANRPSNVKVMIITIAGMGFEPVRGGDSILENYRDGRFWMQGKTSFTLYPQSAVLGSVHDYIPANSSDKITITAGHSWSVGYSGGAGGGLSYSYSENHSHTKETTDFKTLTQSHGQNGIVFNHDLHVVGDSVEVDADKLFSSTFNDEHHKCFYGSITGPRVRTFPLLSRALLKPDSECIYYISASETRTDKMWFEVSQGMLAFWKSGLKRLTTHHIFTEHLAFNINTGIVHYND